MKRVIPMVLGTVAILVSVHATAARPEAAAQG